MGQRQLLVPANAALSCFLEPWATHWGQCGFSLSCVASVGSRWVRHAAAEPAHACSFRPGRQEDAHEYLRCLLDHLHEGHLRGHFGSAKPPPPVEFTTFVHRIFGGRARSQLRCIGVDYESSQYEPFLDLSLEIFRCAPGCRPQPRSLRCVSAQSLLVPAVLS